MENVNWEKIFNYYVYIFWYVFTDWFIIPICIV